MNQFPNVTSQYGAPMGRSETRAAWYAYPHKSIRLYRVRINSGGYDDGGAYWGISQPLYCAEGSATDDRQFVRACDREDAAKRLKIAPQQLIRR